MLIGQDLLDLHPKDVTWIHDGFKVVRHRARLYNPDHFLGFVGVFPTGMEPILKIESHSIALHRVLKTLGSRDKDPEEGSNM